MSDITPEKSTFEKILYGLDKPDAIARAAIGSLLGDKDTPSSQKILKGTDYSARDLIDQVERRTGLDLYAGDKGDKDPALVDSTINTLAELAAYIGISPTGGLLSAAGKAGKAAAGLRGIGEATALQKAAGRAAVGGAIGALSGDSAGEAATNALIGAGVVGAGAPILKGAGKLVGKGGDAFVDAMSRGLNKEAYEGTELGLTEATGILRKNELKRQAIAREIRATDDVLGLTGLDKETSEGVMDFMKSSFSEQNKFRNKLEADILKSRVGAKAIQVPDGFDMYQANRSGKQKLGDRYIVDRATGRTMAVDASGAASEVKAMPKSVSKVDDINGAEALDIGARDAKGNMIGGEIDRNTLNDLTTKSNTYMGTLVNEQLARIGDPKLSAGVKSFVDRNKKIMADYNKSLRARYDKAGKEFIDTIPMDFHIMEILPDHLKKTATNYDNLRTGFVRRTSSEPIQTGGLNLQELLKAESEAFPSHYMTKQEKEAKRLINNIKYLKAKESGAEGVKQFLGAYDGFTGFLKKQHLTFSHSWVINNFMDNLTKAYLAGGAGNLFDTLVSQGKAVFRNSTDNMVKDLLKITDPNGSFKTSINFSDELMPVALKHGAINEGFFAESFGKGQISKEALMAKVGSDRAAEIISEAANAGGIKKAYDKYSDFLSNTVGRTGQLVEGASRGTLFKHSVRNLMRSDDALKRLGVNMSPKEVSELVKKAGYEGASKIDPSVGKIYDEAARVVNETFFDYGAISPFENEVLKRIFPYWTFFSRNIPYWMNIAGEEAARFQKIGAPYKSIGRRPTDDERQSIPDYMLDKGVMVADSGKQMTMPNLSLFDALSVGDMRSSALEKVHPLLKTIKQFAMKEDDFGGELYPSDAKQGRKRVYGAAVKFAPLTDAIYRDKQSGKLYTDSDTAAIATMLQKNLAPVPLIDTIAKAVEDTKSKGLTLIDALENLGPVKQYNLSEGDKRTAKRYRRAADTRERRNKRRRERNR